MAKVIRCALAATCLAASVACLTLWWRSLSTSDQFLGPNYFDQPQVLYIEVSEGAAIVESINHSGQPLPAFERMESQPLRATPVKFERVGAFGRNGNAIKFPLWYPALVFALAGVAALRLGRRFTIRSAIIATTVVAILLGIIVAL